MAGRDDWDAFADQGRHDGDDERVDRARIQERGDDLAPAHEPDVLARLVAQALDERADWFGHEYDAGRDGRRRRPSREHVMHVTATERRAHRYAEVEGLSAQDFGVDGARELRHAVESLWR